MSFGKLQFFFAVIMETLGDQRPLYTTIENWIAEFKKDTSYLKNEYRSGRPISATSLEDMFHIIHDDLDIRKLSAK